MTADGDYYNYTIPAQTAAGTVTYFIWANDTDNNVNQTGSTDIIISADDVLPEIDHTPMTSGWVGASILISATVTDNVAVDEVWLNYNDTASVVSNETMTADGDVFSYTIPAQTAAGDVTYFIWANDTNDNQNMTATETITISADDVLPEIDHTPVTSANTGDTILISAIITDNVAVDEVWLNYTDVASAVSNETMTADGDYYNYTIPAQTAAGSVTYFIWANDTSDNVNQTGSTDITITAVDTEAPTITHDPVDSATAGEDITIEATITDNVAVASATLYYRKTGETAYESVAMTATDGTYSAEVPGSDVTADGVEYYISATDGVNPATSPATNPTTSPHEIEVTEEADTTWLLIAIAIIIIIIIIVVAAAAARGKGPELEEEEEPLEESEEESL